VVANQRRYFLGQLPACTMVIIHISFSSRPLFRQKYQLYTRWHLSGLSLLVMSSQVSVAAITSPPDEAGDGSSSLRVDTLLGWTLMLVRTQSLLHRDMIVHR